MTNEDRFAEEHSSAKRAAGLHYSSHPSHVPDLNDYRISLQYHVCYSSVSCYPGLTGKGSRSEGPHLLRCQHRAILPHRELELNNTGQSDAPTKPSLPLAFSTFVAEVDAIERTDNLETKTIYCSPPLEQGLYRAQLWMRMPKVQPCHHPICWAYPAEFPKTGDDIIMVLLREVLGRQVDYGWFQFTNAST